MKYEKRKIILAQFESWEEIKEFIEREVAIYLYQGGEWDKIEEDNVNHVIKLKNPLTLEQFMCQVKHHFPNGFRIGGKYVYKWGTKIT